MLDIEELLAVELILWINNLNRKEFLRCANF